MSKLLTIVCTPYWATVHRVARRPSELQPAVSEEEDSGGLTCPSHVPLQGFSPVDVDGMVNGL